MKLLHSADWQLGAKFVRFGEKAKALRDARLTTLRRALEKAESIGVDAFLIAGDLFADNHVDNALVDSVVDLFRGFPTVNVIVLPGNHDPYDGPGSVWARRQFRQPPENVTVVLEAGVRDLGGARLAAYPLRHKISTVWPSQRLAEFAAGLPKDKPIIGLAHGSLAIDGKYQSNDNPIAPDAATRGGFDYIALGHWHNWLVMDEDRIVMPGTPEPDGFGRSESGNVALVEIGVRGEPPVVKSFKVSTLTWEELQFDFLSEDPSRHSVERLVADSAEPGTLVVHVTLKGIASPEKASETRRWLGQTLAPCLALLVDDATAVALSDPELGRLMTEHPLLAQVVADFARLEQIVVGAALSDATEVEGTATYAEIETIAKNAGLDLRGLDLADLNLGKALLFEKLREVQS